MANPMGLDDITHALLAGAGVARGIVAGVTDVHKFGLIRSAPAAPVDVWTYGGFYNWLTAPTELELVSTHADDRAGGLGCQEVELHLLDANFDHQMVSVIPNGLTPVVVPGGAIFTRSNRGYGTSCGTYHGSNLGDLILRGIGGGPVISQIDAGQGQTLQSMYTVPRGFRAYLKRLSLVVEGLKDADVSMRQLASANEFGAGALCGRVVHVEPEHSGHGTVAIESWPCFEPMTDLWVTGDPSGAGTTIWADYDLQLVEI